MPQIQGASAADVKRAFNLQSRFQKPPQPQTSHRRREVAVEWTIKYYDGQEGTCVLPRELPDRRDQDLRKTKADRYSIPLFAPTEQDIAAHYERFRKNCHDEKKENSRDAEKNAKSIFALWKSNHRRNRVEDDEYAAITGLQDWEMKCALEGNWLGLSHMLEEGQLIGEPGQLKPEPEWKWEWKLAVWVYKEKKAHDEAKMRARENAREKQKCDSACFERVQTWDRQQWREYSDSLEDREREEEVQRLREEETHVASKAAMVLTTMANEPRAKTPSKKRKRPEKKEESSSPPTDDSADGVRRSSRPRKPKIRYDGYLA